MIPTSLLRTGRDFLVSEGGTLRDDARVEGAFVWFWCFEHASFSVMGDFR